MTTKNTLYQCRARSGHSDHENRTRIDVTLVVFAKAIRIKGRLNPRHCLDIVSDVVMPEMDGPTLLKELRKTNPGLKIIFVSGYPNEAFKSSLGDEEFAFLPKPFSLPQLAAKVKEELAR